MEKAELSLSHFLKDAFEEVFNFDSKFIRTIRLLIFKPGFLTNEIIAGKRVNYIKPFRIYIIVVVLHFLAFSFFKSGDIFAVDRFPLFKLVPGIHELVHQYEVKSGLSHSVFIETVDQKIKDNLNVIFYFIVFVMALYFKLIYFRSGKYYIEHLYYMLHLISFGLIRNIVLIPLVILDLIPIAFVLAAITQLTYTWISLKNVYHEGIGATTIKVFLTVFGFIFVFFPAICLSLAIGIIQLLY